MAPAMPSSVTRRWIWGVGPCLTPLPQRSSIPCRTRFPTVGVQQQGARWHACQTMRPRTARNEPTGNTLTPAGRILARLARRGSATIMAHRDARPRISRLSHLPLNLLRSTSFTNRPSSRSPVILLPTILRPRPDSRLPRCRLRSRHPLLLHGDLDRRRPRRRDVGLGNLLEHLHR